TSAYLVLDPIEGAPLARRAVSVEVARILEPWDSETASWGRRPRLSLPEKAAPLHPRTGAPARIDVTRFVREWSKRLPDDHPLAARGDRCRTDPLPGPRSPHPLGARDAQGARRLHRHGLPGADDIAQPGVHDRRADHGGDPPSPPCLEERRAPRRRGAPPQG